MIVQAREQINLMRRGLKTLLTQFDDPDAMLAAAAPAPVKPPVDLTRKAIDQPKAAASIPPRAKVDWLPAIDADFDQIALWAAARGVAFKEWDDLPKVNDTRERLGQPRFKRRFALKGRFG